MLRRRVLFALGRLAIKRKEAHSATQTASCAWRARTTTKTENIKVVLLSTSLTATVTLRHGADILLYKSGNELIHASMCRFEINASVDELVVEATSIHGALTITLSVYEKIGKELGVPLVSCL